MTQNLYDFIRKVIAEGKDFRPSPSDLVWARGFIQAPDVELNFKAKKIDETTTGEPIYRTDFSFKGEEVQLFELLCEAGMQNGDFAEIITVAARFFSDHVPTCPHCQSNHGAKCPNFRVEIIPI